MATGNTVNMAAMVMERNTGMATAMATEKQIK